MSGDEDENENVRNDDVLTVITDNPSTMGKSPYSVLVKTLVS